LINELTLQSLWLPALIFFVAVGFTEEYIFRGVLQRTTSQVMGSWGIVYASTIFALMHMGFYSWLDVVFVFGIALFFGWSVKKTGSLFGVTLAHGFANIVLYLIAPFFLR
jgi:membrane protease YdiL (CAAX protease family)